LHLESELSKLKFMHYAEVLLVTRGVDPAKVAIDMSTGKIK
jgi:hypothetical protein